MQARIQPKLRKWAATKDPLAPEFICRAIPSAVQVERTSTHANSTAMQMIEFHRSGKRTERHLSPRCPEFSLCTLSSAKRMSVLLVQMNTSLLAAEFQTHLGACLRPLVLLPPAWWELHVSCLSQPSEERIGAKPVNRSTSPG